MGDLLHPGRRVWIHHSADEDFSTTTYDTVVTKFKQFLPKGPLASGDPPSYDGFRTQDLVQFWTDKGLRTVAVAEVHFKDPRKAKK